MMQVATSFNGSLSQAPVATSFVLYVSILLEDKRCIKGLCENIQTQTKQMESEDVPV